MKRWKTSFTQSFQELKDLRNLAAVSMLLAITVVLGFYRLQITEYLRIGFDPLAKELTAMLFGPVAGCAVAGLADIISYIMKPIGAFFPGLTLSAMAGSVIYGVILYRKPLSLGRVILANGLVTVFINLLLNTYWMTVLYGDAFMVLFPARALKQALMFPIDVILFYTVAKLLGKTGVLEGIRKTIG
ncbi:MAG TPA: folate family ECF transporter S component [Candidatus Dorea merdavium]|uniref:folate family ECF transporter S component n=1 Tax=Massilistercora timonensis TaxID=2086584 RepID=UPI000D104EEC|nr:folate family ECF transporter S component [Massilistercora timonensis]HIY55399.1 folate family ECF transporter S component [Candidatus Dorea merdavium]